MDHWEVWNKILERAGDPNGNLTPEERTIYRVNCFLCDVEGGGLSGYLYNISPTSDLHRWSDLRETSSAVAAIGHEDCATILRDLAGVLESLPIRPASTWAEFLAPVSDRITTMADPAVKKCINDLWSKLDDYTGRHFGSGGRAK